jgi:predicted nucleic acid-binding protein
LIAYPDTSFLVSRYLSDNHSQEVDNRMELHPKVFLTAFHRAELTNAIYQQVFRGSLSAQQAQLAYADFEQDCAGGVWVLVSHPEWAFQTCAELARKHVPTIGVRTLDTLHVAAALELKAHRFWTFDERQARLAEAAGLNTAG